MGKSGFRCELPLASRRSRSSDVLQPEFLLCSVLFVPSKLPPAPDDKFISFFVLVRSACQPFPFIFEIGESGFRSKGRKRDVIVSGVEDSGIDRAIGNDADDETKNHAGVDISHVVLLCG
jgi:hypothetical protein